ncbi:MAG: FkbM family methyltransferase [Mucilaginibacter sp.]
MVSKLLGMLRVIEALGFFRAILFVIKRKLKVNSTVKLPGINYPVHLRPGTSDDDVFTQIFVGKEYCIDLGIVPEIIIDAGANIGLSTIWFKNKYPDAMIIAIEPDGDNVAMVKRNTQYYKNVFVIQAALWDRQTSVSVSDKRGMGKWSLIAEESSNNEIKGQQTPTVTIDELMQQYDLKFIDLLKIDIESAEREVFADNYFNWLPKTKVIIIETHDWIKPGCARAFFTAINKTFKAYCYGQVGENVVVINQDLVPEGQIK